MIKPLITNKSLLKEKSEEATVNDLYILQDLEDTFNSDKDCIGMAANMIGCYKKILIVDDHSKPMIMINPVILDAKDKYITEEMCACFKNEAPIACTRYKKIKVEYYTKAFQKRIKNYEGLTAQAIQHQIDHFNGIII